MSRPAELIVLAARIHGVAGAQAAAVTDGRIAAVGTRREIEALRGPRTRVVEAPHGLVCPGFHDAHAHLVPLAQARGEADLHGLGLAGIADAMHAASASRPARRWIVGRGFDPELFRGAATTARALLDEAAPAHPVLLRSHDYHAVATNTLALVAAGFLPQTPRIDGGREDRDEGGALTGILREKSALAASVFADDLTDDELADLVVAAIREFHRAGVVAIHEMSGSRRHALLRRLDAEDRLALDVHATVAPGGPYDAAALAPGRRLRVVGMKAFLDGALGSRTAHLLEPYAGETSHRGVEVLPRDAARRHVEEAAAVGLPSFLHAIGDAAVRAALDVLADVCGPRGEALRHRVEHAQMVHDDDLPRFAAQSVAASVQPVHIALDAPLVHRHWGERAREAFPLRRLLDSGALVVFGSDAPIETPDVVAGIRCAVRRVGRDGTPLAPEEAVTVDEAIDAYTRSAARCVGGESGIRVGAPADLTVFSEDIVRHPETLDDCVVAATIARGALVHEAA